MVRSKKAMFPPALAPNLKASLASKVEAAQKRWPALELDKETFASYLTAQVASSRDPEGVVARLHADDLYLAYACAKGNRTALRILEEQFLARLPALIIRVTLDRQTADEVLQLVRIRLLVSNGAAPPKIESYSGRGPLIRWLHILASRMAIDLIRSDRLPLPTDERILDQLSSPQDVELLYIQRQYQPQVKIAFEKALALLGREERNVLRLYFVEGLTAGEIAILYRTSRSTVSRQLGHIRVELLARIRQVVTTELSLKTEEVESLIRLIRSQLNLSLHRFLTQRSPKQVSKPQH